MLGTYSQAEVYINGGKLAEEASVTVSRRTNAQNVNTVAKGFAGQSPGAAIIEIKVSNAVPAASFELNPGQFMAMSNGSALGVVEVTIFAAGVTLTTKGFITDDNFSHAVNSEAKLEFSVVCSPADWR